MSNRMFGNMSDCGEAGAAEGKNRRAGCVVLGAVCVLTIGVFVWSASSGWSEPSALCADDTYYNLLVQGFRAGQLNLKREAPPGLTQLADPYDPIANIPY